MSKKSRANKAQVQADAVDTSLPEGQLPPTESDSPEVMEAIPSRRGQGLFSEVGIPAGLKRMVFQDMLLEANRELRLSDSELATAMKVEHPGCTGRIDEAIVAGIRSLYNRGVHTKASAKPEQPVGRYENGALVTGRSKKAAEPIVPAELATGTDGE